MFITQKSQSTLVPEIFLIQCFLLLLYSFKNFIGGMKNNKNPYENFDKFVVRSPLLPVDFYKELIKDKSINDEDLKALCNRPIIKEAIFLASPSLYFELKKWLDDELTDKKEIIRLTNSVIKYLSRMSSRCTPFGIFAGCGVGYFSKEHQEKLELGKKNKRHTRLDMNYLVALSQDLIKNKIIRDQLLFYPNTSIYRVGDHLRYVEYYHIKSKRNHDIVSVDYSKYVQKIVDVSKKGILLKDLIALLMRENISKEESRLFIDEIVESQLLISELEPSVTGDEFLLQIISTLKKLDGVKEVISILESIHQNLKKIDTIIGNNVDQYIGVSEAIKHLDTDYDLKFLFQTDMILNLNKNKLNHQTAHKVKRGISFLNKISQAPGETNIKKFRASFYERYENREVRLSQALDTEMGIGYLQNQDSGTINPLIDDLHVSFPSDDTTSSIPWNQLYSILYKKLHKVQLENEYSLKLTDTDFENFKNNWDDLPDTISVMTEIVVIEGEEKIFMSGAGGSSGANLLGRFCNSDEELYEYTKSITNYEAIMNSDKIMAEIVHLPESRVGNILARPVLREYEIPYLANSTLNFDNQLQLDDLMVSVKNNSEVFLRSKKKNKQVLPYLTNAHNYSYNSLPVYHFLSDMQLQNRRSGIGFNWGPLAGEFEFLPRVTYDDIIFSKATWNFKNASIKSFISLMNDEKKLFETFTEWKEKKRLPKYVLLIEGDNQLLICLTNVTSIKILLNAVKSQPSFELSEFLFSEDGILKKEDDYHTNQIIISFYNAEKLKANKN